MSRAKAGRAQSRKAPRGPGSRTGIAIRSTPKRWIRVSRNGRAGPAKAASATGNDPFPKRFRAKWEPVRVKKTRQSKDSSECRKSFDPESKNLRLRVKFDGHPSS